MEFKTDSQCSLLPWKRYIHLTLLMVQMNLPEGMRTSEVVTCDDDQLFRTYQTVFLLLFCDWIVHTFLH